MPFFSPVSRAVIHFSVFLAFIFAFMPGASHAASACTHYASPTGTGNGSSPLRLSKSLISGLWPSRQNALFVGRAIHGSDFHDQSATKFERYGVCPDHRQSS